MIETYREGFMKLIKAVALGILFSVLLPAQQPKGAPETTTAPMSEPVIRQRLQVMGYTNVQITKSNTLRYEIKATKQGQPVVLHFHPQLGTVHDVTPGKAEVRPWHMPVEHPPKFRLEKMPPH